MHRALTAYKRKFLHVGMIWVLKKAHDDYKPSVSLMVVINEILNVTNATYIFIVFTNTYSDYFSFK